MTSEVTRRSLLQMLFALIPIPFLFGRTRKAFAYQPNTNLVTLKKTAGIEGEEQAFNQYYDETEINSKPVWLGSNDKFYSWYEETATGNRINGDEIRLFLDWTPFTPEQPRYARFKHHEFRTGYRGYLRASSLGPDIVYIVTYLDRELKPCSPLFYKHPDPTKMVGESFKSDWS